MTTERDTTAPILTIPGELTWYIWSFVDDSTSGPATPYILASVCRYWRELALANPVLWAKVLVTMKELSGDMKMRLERSQNAPLTVRLVRFSNEAVEALLEHSRRWERLHLDAESFKGVTGMVQELIVERSVSTQSLLPSLRHLTFDLGFSVKDETAKLGILWPNRLESFDVTCRTIQPFLGFLGPSLKELSVQAYKFKGEDLRCISSECPNLVSLYVRGFTFEPYTGTLDFTPMPSLKTVYFNGSFKTNMLRDFCKVTPNCVSMRLKPPIHGRALFFSGPIVPFHSNVTTLHTDISLRNFGDIHHLFAACPRVQSLFVTGILLKGLSDELPKVASVLTQLAKPEVCPALNDLQLRSLDCTRETILEVARKMLNRFEEQPGSTRPRITLFQCEGVSSSIRNDPLAASVDIFLFSPEEDLRDSLKANPDYAAAHLRLMKEIVAKPSQPQPSSTPATPPEALTPEELGSSEPN